MTIQQIQELSNKEIKELIDELEEELHNREEFYQSRWGDILGMISDLADDCPTGIVLRMDGREYNLTDLYDILYGEIDFD